MALTYITYFALLVVSGYCSIINTGSEDIKPLLEDILKRLDEKETRIDQLEETVRIQQTLIQQQQALIQQQQTNMDDQNHRIIALEQEVLVQKQIVSEVEDSNDGEESDVEHIAGEPKEPDADASISKIKRESRVRRGSRGLGVRQVNETPVAFLASLTDHTHNLGNNQNVAFDNVITNIGNAYNGHVGVFVAPVNGIYVFSTSLLSFRENAAHFGFMKNGDMVIKMYHSGINSPWDTTSSTVVLQLAKGDDVTVASLDIDKHLNGNHTSSFTGFLLQEVFDTVGLVG